MHLNRKKIQTKHSLKIRPNAEKQSKKIKKLATKKEINSPKKIKAKIVKTKTISKKKKENDVDIYKPLIEWKNILEGHPIFLLGNAHSISNEDLNILNPYFTIGINRIFFIYEPTVLFWQDRELWNSNKKDILSSKSIRVCRDNSDPNKSFLNFSLATDPYKLKNDPNRFYGRGNSGAIAFQFAVAIGASSVILLGMDCCYDGEKTDFYGKNKDHKKYTLKMCNSGLNWIKKISPIPIYSCSDNKVFEKRKLQEVIEELHLEKFDRNYFKNLLKK
jgi:hypothetical protein